MVDLAAMGPLLFGGGPGGACLGPSPESGPCLPRGRYFSEDDNAKREEILTPKEKSRTATPLLWGVS